MNELATLLAVSRGCARISPGSGHPRPSENGRVATSVPLIIDNSRKARGSRESDDEGEHAERVRKGAARGRERKDGRRADLELDWRGRGREAREVGWFRWAPSRNPSVILNNKDPPAQPPRAPYPLPRQSFTLAGGHRFVTMAKLSIHSGYLPGKRPPPQAGSTRLLSSSPSAFPHREARGRERERGARKGNCMEEKERQEISSAHTYSCAGYFCPRSLLCTSLEIALDHSRKPSPDRLDKNCHCRRVCGTIALFANE